MSFLSTNQATSYTLRTGCLKPIRRFGTRTLGKSSQRGPLARSRNFVSSCQRWGKPSPQEHSPKTHQVTDTRSAAKARRLMKFDNELLRSLPKVLLHEHLDGVLRPRTVIELAKDANYQNLPVDDPQALAKWFFRGANQGSLAKYLEGFAHTIAVMQTEEALQRVAYEQAEDLSRDGVVYFETRFAPIFHTRRGLTHQQVVSATLKGLDRGRKDFGVHCGLIICAMRNMNTSLEMAELAVEFRERGVLGFDLAGEEGGYPPKKHVDAFHYIQRENFNITVHAGEGYGKESIWQAIQYCGAHRIGHGTRLIDDIAVVNGKAVKLGNLAQYVLDKRIPLEICLLSGMGRDARVREEGGVGRGGGERKTLGEGKTQKKKKKYCGATRTKRKKLPLYVQHDVISESYTSGGETTNRNNPHPNHKHRK